MNADTSILLPSAKIGVFAKDSGLKVSVSSLKKDWRFARIDIETEIGDVEAAISKGASLDEYNLIIIETDTVDSSFVKRLEALSEYVSENTAAIIVGPVNDVDLYRQLIAMGVSDYLVLPVSEEKMADVISNALVEQLGAGGSKLIACIGAKGGVGTSSIAHLLGLAAGEMLKEKTLMIDAAGGRSFLSVSMGQEPTTTLDDAAKAAVADDKDNLKRVLVKVRDKTHILASGAEAILDDGLGAEQFESILNAVMSEYPLTIIDLSGSRSSVARRVIERAHKTVLVSIPTVQSLRATRTLQQEYATLKKGEEENSLVTLINMAGLFGKLEIPASEIEKALEKKPQMVIPFEPKCFPTAELEGQVSIENKFCAEIARKLLSIMSDVLKSSNASDAPEVKTDGLLGGLMNKLKK